MTLFHIAILIMFIWLVYVGLLLLFIMLYHICLHYCLPNYGGLSSFLYVVYDTFHPLFPECVARVPVSLWGYGG